MSEPKHMVDRAAGLAALADEDPERIEALEHARGCESCARAWTEAQGVIALLDALPAPEAPSPESLRRVSRAVLAELDAAERAAWAAVPSVVAAVGVLSTVLAKHRSTDPGAWLIAGVAAVCAIACATTARRAALTACIAALVGSAVAIVAATASSGAVTLAGTHCLAIELMAAAAPCLMLAYVDNKRGTSSTAMTYAAVSMAGALSAQGALNLTCSLHEQLSHLLVFHFGGVVLAGTLAAWGARRLVRAT